MGADIAPTREMSGISGRLQDLAQTIRERLWKRAEVRAVMDRCRALGVFDAVGEAIDEVVQLGVSDPIAWALLVGWLDLRTGSDVYTSIPQGLQLRILRQGTGVMAAAHAVFDRRFAALAVAAA
jgi:hypothetical protein